MKIKYLLAVVSILCIFVFGCSRYLDVPEGEWKLISSEHFNYHYQANSKLSPEDLSGAIERLEWFWDFAAGVWDYDSKKIDYYYFLSREDVKKLTGRDMNAKAIVEKDIVLSIFASDTHEVSHLFTTPAGSSLDIANFWMEGIAMYYTWPKLYYPPGEARLYAEPLGAWHGHSVHYWAKELLAEGSLPDLEPLIYGNRHFDSLDANTGYPVAGSFVTYLLGRGHSDLGMVEKYMVFMDSANKANSKEEAKLVFSDVFGKKFIQVERGWKEFLLDWQEESLY
ncbi:MAG: hypothetical protein R6U35_08535 [Candidatus Humimicrobiaceae bacterium]